MEDGERIPIDIGAPLESAVVAEGEVSREDGTIVVDLTGKTPCDPAAKALAHEAEADAAEGGGDTIVVCAPPQPDDTFMNEIGRRLNTSIGGVEIGSIDNGDGTRRLGLRIRF